MSARIVSVNVGRAVPVPWEGAFGRSAIDKRPVAGAVAVGPLGPAGDEHANGKLHGGEYQAVYAYAEEDAQFWAGELGRPVRPGAFGENLTTAGLDLTGAVVGERWRVGPQVLLEVTSPRIPCRVFAGFWDVPDLVRRFTDAGRPGAYLRVVEQGALGAGDQVEVVSRPEHGVTIVDLLRLRTGDRTMLERVRAIPTLMPKWRQWIESVAPVKASG